MRNIMILIYAFLCLFSKNSLALQYPVEVFNNIQSGYENGQWWILLNAPTRVEGGSWAAGLPSSSYVHLVVKTPENVWKDPNWETTYLKKRPGETRSGAILRYNKSVAGHGNFSPYINKKPLKYDPSNYCVVVTTMVNSLNPGGILAEVDPPPYCSYIPPVPAQCNITTTEIVLDHKTVLQKDVDNSRIESSFKINCSRQGNVKFSLENSTNTIPLGNGHSTVSINNLPLKSNIKVNVGDNLLTIVSTLNGVEPGTWQGSAVLKLEPF